MDRIFPPTRFDSAPYRTICKVRGDSNVVYEFIQLNDDEENPYWVPVGEFLYKALCHKLSDQRFIDECIQSYHCSKLA